MRINTMQLELFIRERMNVNERYVSICTHTHICTYTLYSQYDENSQWQNTNDFTGI